MVDTNGQTAPRGFFPALVLTCKRRPGFALWILILFALYSLGVGVLLPYFAKPYLEKTLSREMGVSCTIRTLTANPFTLKIIARDMSIPYPESARDKAGDFLLRLDRLELMPSLLSVKDKTLIVDEMRFVRPYFSLARFRDGTLSPQLFFSGQEDAGARKTEENPKEKTDGDEDIFPVVIHNIAVEDGSLDVRDALHDTAYTVTAINLAVPFASTRRTDRDIALTPSLSAVVNGKELVVRGESRPFAHSRQTVFTLNTRDLNLADFHSYFQPFTNLTLTSGFLHTELTLRFAQDAEQAFDFALAGTASITDLALADKNGTVLRLGKASVDAENVVFGPRRVLINEALLENPEVVIRRAKNGTVDWTGFFSLPENTPQADVSITTGSGAAVPVPGMQAPRHQEGPPLQLVVRNSKISNGKITWHDAMPKTPVLYVMDGIHGTFSDVSNQDGGLAEFSLGFGTGASTVTATGSASIHPMRVDCSLTGKELPVAPFYPYLPVGNLALEGGLLSLSGDFVFQHGPEPIARLDKGRVSFSGLKAHVGAKTEQPQATVRQITVEQVSADMVKKTLNIGAVTGTGITADLRRGADGKMVLPVFVSTSSQQQSAMSGSKPGSQQDAGGSWQVGVETLSLGQSKFSFTDESMRRKVEFSLSDITAKGKNFANHGNKRWNLSVSAKPDNRSKLALSANGTLSPLDLTFSGNLDKVDIRTLSPYLRQVRNIRLSEGSLGSDFTGSARRVPDSARGGEFAIKGNFGIYWVTLVHRRMELGSVGRMRIANFDYRVPASGGHTCDIESITVNSPRLAVSINETGASTLASALSPQEDESTPDESSPEPSQHDSVPAAARTDEPAFSRFTIGSVKITQGQATYLDKRVSPPYTLKVGNVNASMNNISLDHEAYAAFVGNLLINGSPVSCTAAVKSLFHEPSGNGTLSVRSLDLSRFTQYAEKYLGYSLARGSLTLSAIGSLNKRELSIHNSVLIRTLDLGKKVKSPYAADMPLSAAVSLLRDGNGDISLELPVSGTLGDPEFKLGGVVGKVIGNVIFKTVTSPFALVGGVLGGFIDLLSSKGSTSAEIVFGIGENTLDDAARESLEKLGEEMRKRPKTMLRITGMADRAEKNSLVEAWVLKALKLRKYNALPKEEKAKTTPDAILVGPEHNTREYSRLLYELYGTLPFVKQSKDPEITSPPSTRALMRILNSRWEIGDGELLMLARSRAIAVYHALSRGKIDIAARIRILDPVLLDVEETRDRLSSYARIEVTQ